MEYNITPHDIIDKGLQDGTVTMVQFLTFLKTDRSFKALIEMIKNDKTLFNKNGIH